MDRHAQGLPITTIIIAILGLVVLVILFAITTGRLAIFGRGVSECPGACVIASPPQGAPASVRKENCNPTFEKDLSGNFIAAGLKPDQKPQDFVCSQCCVPIA